MDGSKLPIAIDQIESGEWGIMGFMFNIMESGEGRVSSGGVDFTVKSLSTFAFLANVEDEDNPEKSFGALLKHLTENPAFGRRFGIIIYGNDYNIITGRSSYEAWEEWKRCAMFLRAVEEYAEPQLETIYKDQRIWTWISLPILGYNEKIITYTKSLNNALARSFLREHGKAGQVRVRSAALSIALLDHLDRIALNDYDLTTILEYSEHILEDIVSINLESIANMAENISNDIKLYAKAAYERQPEYIQIIIAAVEYARRNKIASDVFYLNALDYSPESETYTHLSKAAYKYTQKIHNRAILNTTLKQYFGFTIEPDESGLMINLDKDFAIPLSFIAYPASVNGENSETGENGEKLTPDEQEKLILSQLSTEYGFHKDKIISESSLSGLSVEESIETIKRLEKKQLIHTPTKPNFYYKVKEAGSV